MEIDLSVIYDNFVIELNGCNANVRCSESYYCDGVFKILSDKIESSPVMSKKINISMDGQVITLKTSKGNSDALSRFVEDVENYNSNKESINKLVDKNPAKAASVLHEWIKDS